MAGKVKIRLFLASPQRDANGEAVGEPLLWREVWADLTTSGGGRRTYAGRLATEHNVVLSTHWLPGIDTCELVEFNGRRRPIDDVVSEDRRRAHIITTMTDRDYGE